MSELELVRAPFSLMLKTGGHEFRCLELALGRSRELVTEPLEYRRLDEIASELSY